MKTIDNVSPELRKVEKEIDNYYKSNPLLKLPFATAASYLLRSAEEYMLNEQIDGIVGIQDRHALGVILLLKLSILSLGSTVIVNKMGKSTLLMTQTFTKHPRIYLS